MRYQLAALITGVITVLALGAASASLWLSVSSGDDSRREAAAEAEIDAIRAALGARAAAASEQARTLLADPEIAQFAMEGGAVPDALANGGPALGSAGFAALAGPEGDLVWRSGSETAASVLLDAASEGGIVDLDAGPVLVASARGEGEEGAVLVLGVPLDQQTLSTMTPDDSRQLSLAWASEDAPPEGIEVLPGTNPGRISIVAPLGLGRGERPLIAVVDAPEDALPEAAGASISRWAIALTAIGLAGAVASILIVRNMASRVADLRQGLATAEERDGSPAVLDALSGKDEVGQTAVQAAATLRSLRNRTMEASDEARLSAAREVLGREVLGREVLGREVLGEHVIRSMQEGVLVERSDGTCLVCNPAAARLLGVDPDEVVGQQGVLGEVLGSDLYDRVISAAAGDEHDPPLSSRTDAGRDLALDAFRVREPRGDGDSLLVLVREAVPRETAARPGLEGRTQGDAVEALREPLDRISRALESMRDPGADVRALQRGAAEDARRLHAVIENAALLTRLERGEVEPHREAIEPAALAREVCDSLRPRAAERNIVLRDALDGTIPSAIEADANLLRRAVSNIVANAVDYSPPGATAWLVLREGRETLFIDVADAGPGISEDERASIFAPCYRGAGASGSAGGAGLGLPVARAIAELHGGAVDLLPTEQGAYFRITLPVRVFTSD